MFQTECRVEAGVGDFVRLDVEHGLLRLCMQMQAGWARRMGNMFVAVDPCCSLQRDTRMQMLAWRTRRMGNMLVAVAFFDVQQFAGRVGPLVGQYVGCR